jgi:hypothetical protein
LAGGDHFRHVAPHDRKLRVYLPGAAPVPFIARDTFFGGELDLVEDFPLVRGGSADNQGEAPFVPTGWWQLLELLLEISQGKVLHGFGANIRRHD